MARADRPIPFMSAAPDPVRDIAFAGAFTGLVAGLAMALCAMLGAAGAGERFFLPAELVAAALYGPQALGRTDAIFAGVVVHLLVAAAWGMLFAAIVTTPTTRFETFLGGLFYGIFIWVVMTFVVLPLADPTMHARALADAGFSLVDHLIFGAGMALLIPIRERLAG
jgi:hypothetical protein